MNIEDIARIGFYVEGAVNRSSDAAQPALVPSWETLSDEQKQMVIRAAQFAIENPDVTHHAVYAEFAATPEGSTVGSVRTGFTGTTWTTVGAAQFADVVRSLAHDYMTEEPAQEVKPVEKPPTA
jgi:hypothetical protein